MDVTSYLLGKKSGGGGGKINNQNKDITITENGSTSVSADAGYTGLGTVGITTNVTPDLESKSVTINSNTTTVITPSIDKDGLSQVSVTTNVEAQPDLETKSVTITENGTTTITPTTGKDGMSEVEVTTNVSGGGVDEYFVTTTDSRTAAAIKLIKKFPPLDLSSRNSLTNFFKDCTNLIEIPQCTFSSNITDVNGMFSYCSQITTAPLFDISKAQSTARMFSYCTSLITLPTYNISSATDIAYMCYSCSNLENVPVFNFSKIIKNSNIENIFFGCSRLTDASLDNILQSCISAVSFTGTKTLTTLGISKGSYPASRIQALPHYQDFLDAGWTIGY